MTKIDLKVYNADTNDKRERLCINCGRRNLWGAGSRCEYDGHYIGYCGVWEEWCRHWTKDKRKLGEIKVYAPD